MPHQNSPTRDLAHAASGLLMGAADAIPGVSGGTVALLLGIYPRLLSALSQFNREFLRLLASRQWKAAVKHIDLRFLLALAVGIVLGAKTLAEVMLYLLEEHRHETLAAFFGLILASGILVGRMSKPTTRVHKLSCLALGIVAAVFAAWLVSGSSLEPRDHLGYTFLCGTIAICAMILPGISGAYILVLLGQYERILEIFHKLTALEANMREVATFAIFAFGCLVGLLTFSRVVKAMLARHFSETMAVLGGFMIGSLIKVWPFQAAAVKGQAITKTSVTRPVLPDEWSSQVINCAVIAVVSFTLVLAIDYAARRLRPAID